MVIGIEGVNGSGKSTLCNNLKAYFDNNQVYSNLLHDPDENEIIGKFIYDSKSTGLIVDPKIWSMLYACSSINLQSGPNGYLLKKQSSEIVILDRTVLSSYAYFGETCEFEWLDNIHTPYVQPDLTILLDLDTKENLERLIKRESIEKAPNLEKLEKIKVTYGLAFKHFQSKKINIAVLEIGKEETEIQVLNKVIKLINEKGN